MSVLVTIKMNGDTDIFRKSLAERADEVVTISEHGKASGAIHHQFGIGDGFVLVVDEWDTVEHFQAFFGDPKLQTFIGEIGGDTSMPPEITVTEAIDSPDKY